MIPRFPCLVAFAAIAIPSVVSAAPVSVPRVGKPFVFDSKKFMRVSELKPGMHGYALTTFHGTTISRFNIVILGVISKFNNGKDYILFRALDGPPVTRRLNIAHGMSGSPIYIGGRLVGAISMGVPGTQFAKDPIALATPIEYMFDAWRPKLPTTLAPISAGNETPNDFANTGTELPEETIQTSGLSPQILARLGRQFAPLNLNFRAGGAIGGPLSFYAKSATLQPGAPVGISIVQGDVDMSYMGTVTYRQGKRILMFGHPLFDLGPVDAPMTTAYVADVFPSYQDSIMLAGPLNTVGRIYQDRPFSVSGVIGQPAKMIPLDVTVDDRTTGRVKKMHAFIINNPLLTSKLVTSVADQLISDVHGQPGDSMARVTLDADVEEVGHVHRTNTVFDSASIDQSAVSDLEELMTLTTSNPFYPLGVKAVKLNVVISPGHNTAEIDRIYLKQKTFSPGDTVHVGVVLKPFKHAPVTRDIALAIPENTPPGTFTLAVKGGASDDSSGISSPFAGLIILRPATTENDATVEQLIKRFQNKPRNNQVIATIALPTTAISVRGEKLSGLPPNFAAVMKESRTTGLKAERDEVKVVAPSSYVVTGSQTLTIIVQRKDQISAGTTPLTIPAPQPVTTVTTIEVTPPAVKALDQPSVALSDDADPAPFPGAQNPIATPTGSVTVKQSVTTPSPAKQPKAAPVQKPAPHAVTITAVGAPFQLVSRLPMVWHVGSESDFAVGSFSNLGLTHDGKLTLAGDIVKVADEPASTIWAIQPDGEGGSYLATGNGGKVFHVDSSGKSNLFFTSDDPEITALAKDSTGNVFVATAPSGVVYRVTPGGKQTTWMNLPKQYVTAMELGTDGKLVIATGGGTGHVYVGNDSHPGANLLFTTSENHILSLATASDGSVYAGTAPDGLIYKISPTGQAQIVYNATESDLNALAITTSGDVIAGTGPQGALYRIKPDGTSHLIIGSLPGAITGLQTGQDGEVYACADSIIYKVNADDTVVQYSTPEDQQFSSLAVVPGDGVLVGTTTIAELYKLPFAASQDGVYTSAVRDAGRTATWGSIGWDPGQDDGITFETRSGGVSEPDQSWSPWSAPMDTSGGKITSPPARYLQFKATLKRSDSSSSGTLLRSVSISYLTANLPPTVAFTSPVDGNAVSKIVAINWTGSDPDNDTLTYELYATKDDGKTYTHLNLPKAVNPTSTGAATSNAPANTPNLDAAKKALDKHPDMPLAVRNAILKQMQQTAVSTPPTTDTGTLKLTTFSWDTKTVPDGVYQLKIVASDITSNPTGSRTAESLSGRFIVSNTPPVIMVTTNTVDKQTKMLTIHGRVASGIATNAAVQYRVDKGPTMAAAADSGLFGSRDDAFTISVPITAGPHTIQIQAIDRAGNWSVKDVTIKA